ncbi:MAG: DUF2235 domain-containing protein [Alphaproteobacteria bacterium]
MKNLVVCLDGTWNDADRPTPLTNIGRIARLVEPKPEAAPAQRVYYDTGVGTAGGIDRFTGGLLGIGLSENVLQAYRFLAQFYEDGDGIHVFGFSRGAFTARSLCGFLSASGLLRPQQCDRRTLAFAWNYYRTPPKERYPADRVRLDHLTHSGARVRFLGVFDTVGALGIPRRWLNWIGRHRFAFHDTEVSSVVDHSCHALGIDEKRIEFEPAIWDEPRHRGYRTVEQVWFPGVHSNIGGGYKDTGLSDLTLEWMLNRLRRYCPEVTMAEDRLHPDPMGELYESRSWLYGQSRRTPLIRTINRFDAIPPAGFRLPTIKPHSRPIGEALHWSAVARLSDETYRPPNLVAAYAEAERGRMLIVGANGEAAPVGAAP